MEVLGGLVDPRAGLKALKGGEKNRSPLLGLETWSLSPKFGNYTECAVPPRQWILFYFHFKTGFLPCVILKTVPHG